MFAFGFGGILVITQMHGLGLSCRVRWIILALYISAALLTYGLYDLTKIHQITWIPISREGGRRDRGRPVHGQKEAHS